MFAVLNRNACRNDVIGSRRRPGNRNRRLPIPHILAIARNPGMVHWPRDRVDFVALTAQGARKSGAQSYAPDEVRIGTDGKSYGSIRPQGNWPRNISSATRRIDT